MFVKIDFRNTYHFDFVSDDLRSSNFQAELNDDSLVSLHIRISAASHELLPNVYNMAFGPLNPQGQIDHQAQLTYKDYSKVFSTILWSALMYLNEYTDHFLGIDGSDNRRAHMYFRFLQRNYEYLDKCFRVYGIKYYVRITRFGKQQYDDPFDFDDVQYISSAVSKNAEIPSPMVNYFTINLK